MIGTAPRRFSKDKAFAFVRSQTKLVSIPLLPEIRLHLATEITPLWQATETMLEASGLPPPYWAFAWAGGQALARYILDHSECTHGKRVLDFAAGSGVAGIAAALVGATRVEATELDPLACAALALNAEANGVAIGVLAQDMTETTQEKLDCAWDVVLAGDVCYERPMATRATTWLRRVADAGSHVLLGDPGRAYLPKEGLLELARYTVSTPRELEDQDSRLVTIYRLPGAGANLRPTPWPSRPERLRATRR